MKINKINIEKNIDRTDKLWALLNGKIFHCTKSITSMDSIIEDGFIKNNKEGKYETTTGQSKSSYASYKGYVSVFNLKNIGETINGENSFKWITERHNPLDYPIFFILKNEILEGLISWKQVEIDKLIYRAHIPHVEYYYDDQIPLEKVEEIIVVNGGM